MIILCEERERKQFGAGSPSKCQWLCLSQGRICPGLSWGGFVVEGGGVRLSTGVFVAGSVY